MSHLLFAIILLRHHIRLVVVKVYDQHIIIIIITIYLINIHLFVPMLFYIISS